MGQVWYQLHRPRWTNTDTSMECVTFCDVGRGIKIKNPKNGNPCLKKSLVMLQKHFLSFLGTKIDFKNHQELSTPNDARSRHGDQSLFLAGRGGRAFQMEGHTPGFPHRPMALACAFFYFWKTASSPGFLSGATCLTL